MIKEDRAVSVTVQAVADVRRLRAWLLLAVLAVVLIAAVCVIG